MMCPEGTWNLTPSKPMLPLNWGIIDLAKQTGVPIIPLILEYHPDCCYAKYGEPIYINEEMDKQSGIEQLEESMATLKWDIWEHLPREKRAEIPSGYHEKFVQERLAECAGFTKELVEGRMFRDKTDREILAIKRDLERVRNKSS